VNVLVTGSKMGESKEPCWFFCIFTGIAALQTLVFLLQYRPNFVYNALIFMALFPRKFALNIYFSCVEGRFVKNYLTVFYGNPRERF
jgi:hypothetical protein